MAYTCVDCEWSIDGESVENAGSAAIEHHVDSGHAIERRPDRSDEEITVGAEDANRARSD
ncbi:hypothetical protein [Saliphagus sp. LR7]|uniref:hypothetical protein n=1 Tax=Saliphagus sp. LR7 TaxID=2282654 RepID=UPI000DF7F193|nr:hypothetical protein [Saliphagus sp. LR7]